MNKADEIRKVQILWDIEEIKKMHMEYVYALCALEFDRMLDFWVEDGVLELGPNIIKGKKEIYGFFQNFLAKNVKLTDGHIVCQPVITVEGEKAKAHWILYVFAPEPKVGWVQGRQDAEYVRVKGQWKIKTLKYTRPWPPIEAKTH